MTRLQMFRPLRTRFAFHAAAWVGLVVAVATLVGCNGIRCQNLSVVVPPGGCTQIGNPCQDGNWTAEDTFTFHPEDTLVEGLSIRTDRSDGTTERFFCADADAPLVRERQIRYSYQANSFSGGGFGVTHVMIAPPLEAFARAEPAAIHHGKTAQLLAKVSGGVPPYAYFWAPEGTLDDPSSGAPVASPSFTTQYRLVVSDAFFQVQEAFVTVVVDAPEPTPAPTSEPTPDPVPSPTSVPTAPPIPSPFPSPTPAVTPPPIP
jgi:hypothetical protein